MPGRYAQGVAFLIGQQNEALRRGDAEALAKAGERLARFMAASVAAASGAAQAQASCRERPPALAAEIAEPMARAAGPAPASQAAPTSTTNRYSIASATLAEAYAYLVQHLPGTKQEPEFMLAVSGTMVDEVRTLDRLIEVRMDCQSFGQAAFDMQDFTRIAVALFEHGQELHAVFHSHRFGGVPTPSGTDMRLQSVLEEGGEQSGYPAIQAIFSEDGYVRFFAKERPFRIEIHGTGVRPVDGQPNTFRIVQFSTLPHPAPAAATAGRGDGVRSLPAPARR
jgi:hypothetical protein